MYVLMDLEWFETQSGKKCPTQIAALRMSEEWTTTDTFYERICPSEGVTVPWNHISFAQEPSENYLYAPCAGTVFGEFRDWLRSDDFLCWWTRESAELFDALYEEACGNECPQPHRFLKNFFASKIKDGFTHRGNLYSLARERGLTLFCRSIVP